MGPVSDPTPTSESHCRVMRIITSRYASWRDDVCVGYLGWPPPQHPWLDSCRAVLHAFRHVHTPARSSRFFPAVSGPLEAGCPTRFASSSQCTSVTRRPVYNRSLCILFTASGFKFPLGGCTASVARGCPHGTVYLPPTSWARWRDVLEARSILRISTCAGVESRDRHNPAMMPHIGRCVLTPLAGCVR